jgi:very-short-patch-repair endonuclease
MTSATPSGIHVFCRADLLAMGMRPKQITRAVRGGVVVRVRRDRYMFAPVARIDRAVRVGGRLACVSVLSLRGVFVFDDSRVHVHLERSMSRMRSPVDRTRAFGHIDRASTTLHWSPLRADGQSLGVVSVADALAQAVRCQDARSAVATVDSVLHQGVLSEAEVRDVFASLPARYGVILRLTDPRSEAGTESLMRLILRQLGVRFEVQVVIDDVGRVDFLVEGWLIVECDSKAHHEGWVQQRRDRRRDLAAARQGFVTLRPLAEDLLYDRETVVRAVSGLMAAHRRRR